MSKPLKEAAWRLVLPEIRQIVREEMQSAMGEINAKFEALNMKIDSSRNELKTEITSVRFNLEGLDKRLDVVQRLAILEAEVKELRKKTES
jgi:hypothetical protein